MKEMRSKIKIKTINTIEEREEGKEKRKEEGRKTIDIKVKNLRKKWSETLDRTLGSNRGKGTFCSIIEQIMR